MKKTNLYYKTVYARKSVAVDMTMLVFLFFLSWPRLLLEVFVRKNFGERYFSMFTAVALTIFLSLVPIGIDMGNALASGRITSVPASIVGNITWYIFFAAFIYNCIKRQAEIKREPGVFDFAKFSLSTGEIDPRFYAVKLKGRETTSRVVSTLLEPAFFLAIGIALWVVQQKIGVLITFCSICYSLGYYGDYVRGDHFIMDKIDEMICTEELAESFVEGKEPKETRGFETGTRRPANKDFRRKVVDSCFEDDRTEEAY